MALGPREPGEKQDMAYRKPAHGSFSLQVIARLITRAQVIEPYIRELAPDLIIVSAGFDAAEGDLLGGMRLSPACYGAQLCVCMKIFHAPLAILASPCLPHR